MSTHDNTSDYLVALNEALATRLDRAERILTEIDDYLQSDIAERMAKGTSRPDAERAAIAQLGPPEEVAGRFGSDPAGSLHQRLWRNWERLDRWSPEHPWLGTILFPVLPVAAFLLVMGVWAWILDPPSDGGDTYGDDAALAGLSLLCLFLAFGTRNRALVGRNQPSQRARVGTWSAEHPWLAAAVLTSGFFAPGVWEIFGVINGEGDDRIFISLMGLGVFFSTVYRFSYSSCSVCVGEIPATETRISSRPKWLENSFRFLNDHWVPAMFTIYQIVLGNWIFAVLILLIFNIYPLLQIARGYIRGARPKTASDGRYSRWSRAHPFLGTLLVFSIGPTVLLVYGVLDSELDFSTPIAMALVPFALMLSVIWLFDRKASKDSLPRDLTTEANNI